MVCPNCNLINPDTATRCNCGYNFDTKKVEALPQPPQQPAPSGPVPAYSLFDATSVGLATFFGSPVAGSVLMAINYRRMGNRSLAVWVVPIGLAVTAADGLLATRLSSHAFSYTIQILVVVAVISAARSIQGAAVAEHVDQGGRLASKWTAAGFGFAGMAVFLGLFFLGAFGRLPTAPVDKVVIGAKDSVFFAGTATAADASALGAKLKDIGYFTDKGITAGVSKDSAGEAVAFLVQDGVWNQPQVVFGYEIIGLQIAPVAGGYPLRVRLANAQRQTQKEVTVGETAIGTKDQVWYFGSATEADAKALGQVLLMDGFFVDKGFVAMLSKDGDTVVSLVVADGIWDQPATVAALQKMIRDNAPAIGGLPVKLRLLSSPGFETKLEVPVN